MLKNFALRVSKLDFFCPHGGARDSEGRSNVHFGMPEEMRESVRWVLNRHSIKLNGVRSDGGFRNKERWDNLDLRDLFGHGSPEALQIELAPTALR